MKDYVKRMIEEKDELDLRIGKLGNFMNSVEFMYINDSKKKLMRRQHVIMTMYSDVLEQRLMMEDRDE